MLDLIIVQEGDSVIDRFRALKTAAEVLNALRRIGELRDEGGVRLLGSDSLEAGNYTFKQIDVPSTPAADLSSIWKEMKGIMEISLLPLKKQLQYTKSKMSRGLNDNFKAALIDYYGVDQIDSSPTGSKNAKHHGNRKLRCMMTGCMLPRRDVCVAYLIVHSMQDYALKVFGITDIDSPRNGLLVVKPIEEAFNDSRLCFSFDVTRSGFILHVLDASYLTESHLQLTRPSKRILGNTTFGDLEGQSLQFPNSMRPFKRVLQFQARQAIALASERGTLPETFSAAQWDFDYGSMALLEVISRKVIEDDGYRQVVEVDQAAVWRFLWFSGTLSVCVLVD